MPQVRWPHAVEGEPGVVRVELAAHGEDIGGVKDWARFGVDLFGDEEDLPVGGRGEFVAVDDYSAGAGDEEGVVDVVADFNGEGEEAEGLRVG